MPHTVPPAGPAPPAPGPGAADGPPHPTAGAARSTDPGTAPTGHPQDAPADPDGPVGFRPLTPGDLPMLAGWLAEPHVHRWWYHETSPEAVERDFGPAMRGEEPAEDLVVELAGTPVGLLQRCRWHDYPEYVEEIAPLLDVPVGAATIDYLIGVPGLVGRGLGPRIIAAASAGVWERHPDACAIIVPVMAGNRASWRALEKAGFRRVAEGRLTPDNPIDPPHAVVLRLDRPSDREPQEQPSCHP